MAKKFCKQGNKPDPRKEKDLKYECKSCGGKAVKEKFLCKPIKH